MKVKYWQREPIGKSKKTVPRRLRGKKPEPEVDPSKWPTFSKEEYFTQTSLLGVHTRDDVYEWGKGGTLRTTSTNNSGQHTYTLVYHGANCSYDRYCSCAPTQTIATDPVYSNGTVVNATSGFSDSYTSRHKL